MTGHATRQRHDGLPRPEGAAPARRPADRVSRPGRLDHLDHLGRLGRLGRFGRRLAEPATGTPLERELGNSLSGRFGFDFSAVRVHADPAAASAARDLGARAFTVGSHIYFGPGWYPPRTTAGRALLTHELTHVVQQSRARPAADPQIMPASDISEREAGLGRVSAYLPRQVIQRQADAGVADAGVAKPRFRPGDFSSYGDWIAALPAGAVDENAVDVSAQVKRELPDLADLVTSLRADCADVAILLRHYYLAAHDQTQILKSANRKEPDKPFEYPIGKGVTRAQLRSALSNLGTVHFQETPPRVGAFITYYGGRSPVKNLKQLLKAGLKPGDVLVWKRLPGISGNFQGHVQTIHKIVADPADSAGARIEVVQGTMEEGQAKEEIQSKVLKFELLTGKKDGDGAITYQPESEEEFFGGGHW